MSGILLAILAAAMFSVGAIMQKIGVQDLPDIKMSDIKTMTPMLKNRIWVIGTIIALTGGVPYIASQSFIGIGYTQLLLAVGLIILVFLSHKYLSETIGALEWGGIVAIIGGTICLGLAQLSDVNVTLASPDFLINSIWFYCLFGIIIAGGLILYKFKEGGVVKIMAILSGIFFGVGAFSAQIGTLGLEEGNLLIAAIGFLLLIGGNTIGTVVVQIAFQSGKAVVAIPLQSAGNYLIPVFAGLLIFQQVFASPVNLFIYFIPAVILIMAGVILLSRIQAELEKTPPPLSSKENTSTDIR
ncbi:MAG: hypothetical protein ACTSRL_11835 [Candidatus Helarchaeota archaeon]